MRKYAKKFARSLRKRNDFDYQLEEIENEEQSEIQNYVPPPELPIVIEAPVVIGQNEMTAKELMHHNDHMAPPTFNKNFNF